MRDMVISRIMRYLLGHTIVKDDGHDTRIVLTRRVGTTLESYVCGTHIRMHGRLSDGKKKGNEIKTNEEDKKDVTDTEEREKRKREKRKREKCWLCTYIS